MGDWINQNLQILATLGSALAVYVFIRLASKKDIDEVKVNIREINASLKSIDSRLSHLEGAFEERGRQEPKIFLIKGDQIVEK